MRLTYKHSLALLMMGVSSIAVADQHLRSTITLPEVVELAIKQDPWFEGNLLSQSALQAKGMAASQLPDPKLSLALANMPTDSFDFNQEAMTQLVFGVSQKIPRGDTLQLSGRNYLLQGEQLPLQRAVRAAQVKLTITQLWLDAANAKETAQLLEKNRRLFQQLADISLANYTSGLSSSRQQQLIRTELEQEQLEDRLYRLQQKEQAAEQQLQTWLLSDRLADDYQFDFKGSDTKVSYPFPERFLRLTNAKDSELMRALRQHPTFKLLEKKYEVRSNGVQLAEQAYKPEWMLNASYGHRGEDGFGRDRSDLVTFGVSVDMPIFSQVRQDQNVKAAIAEREMVKTEQLVMLREMLSAFNTAKVQALRLEQRQQHYQSVLIPKLHAQSHAAESAYQNDTGDFSEVVRSQLAELNAKVELINITTDMQKQLAQMDYLLSGSAPSLLEIAGGDHE